jgi:hypothetical protein
VDERRVGSRRERIDEARRLAAEQQVVRVEEAEVLAPSRCRACVSSGAGVAPAGDDAHHVPELGERVHRAVARTRVGHDDLQRRHRRRQRRPHRVDEQPSAVARGNDDADAARHSRSD